MRSVDGARYLTVCLKLSEDSEFGHSSGALHFYGSDYLTG